MPQESEPLCLLSIFSNCCLEKSRKSNKFQFFKNKLGVIPLQTLVHFRSYSINSYSNLALSPTLCNLACQKVRSYSFRSYSPDLIPTTNLHHGRQVMVIFRKTALMLQAGQNHSVYSALRYSSKPCKTCKDVCFFQLDLYCGSSAVQRGTLKAGFLLRLFF